MQAMIMPYGLSTPDIHPSAWIAPTAVVIGETVIKADTAILFHCVLRGDINRIEIGLRSNIQDQSMLHVGDDWPCIVGNDVTVGHCVLLHGCVVEDGCLIGMGARVLNGAVIGRGSIVAAGAVVPEGMHVPPGSLVAGVPAQLKGPVQAKHVAVGYEQHPGKYWAEKYQKVAQAYRTGRAFRPNLGLDPEE
jgi:carbonic anhydrase/acetyltransferase-like protein (isoleucine patch superfamily)